WASCPCSSRPDRTRRASASAASRSLPSPGWPAICGRARISPSRSSARTDGGTPFPSSPASTARSRSTTTARGESSTPSSARCSEGRNRTAVRSSNRRRMSGRIFLNQSTQVFTDDNWEAEVLEADGTVLVDFWAAWCPPCRALSPLVDELALEYQGRLKVGKLDVDGSPEVAARYGITSIPTLLVFQGGQVVAQR